MITVPPALSRETMDVLEEALDRARAEPIWILSGSCQGMDLFSFAAGTDVLPHLRRFADLISTIRSAPAPTIFVAEGPLSGGGVGIAAACDVVIATQQATFALPEALFGLLPGVVIPVLLHRMTPHAVQLLSMVGTAKSAAWAESNGLVDEITDDVPRSISTWKRALARVDRRRIVELREWTQLTPKDALERGAKRTARAADPTVRRAVRAFLEHGEAPWQR